MNTTKITGAQAVMRSLVAENVTTIFGYPGGAIMPIYDALYDYEDTLNHILVRHEQGAIHAAQGFARTSKKTGVVFATSGPGATNLITGLADALIDSTPLVCITGQVASHLLGTDAFQETDVVGISMPITKWNCQVTKAADIPAAIAKAFYIAQSGRPGPVLIDITKDAQFGEMDFKYEKCTSIRSYHPKPKLNKTLVEAAAKLIDSAKKPYLLIGQGIMLSNAENELLAFVEKTGIPVASTLLGLGAFPQNHLQYAGYLGMHGDYAPNIKTNECDVLIAIGMRFDDRVTGDVSRYAKQAKVIHVDIDASELNKIIKADIGIHADAKETLCLLTDLVQKKQHTTWLQEFKDAKKVEVETLQESEKELHSEELKMDEVIKILSELTNGEAVVVTDVGQHQMMTARYYQYNKTKSNITSGGLGTMGFALPAAIGAKFGAPDKPVIAIIGDGGFQMTLQELGTILQTKVDIKIIILNNRFLGMVRQWQQMFFEKRYSFTNMVSPDFVALAKAYSIEAKKIEARADLKENLLKMINHNESYLLEIMVAKEENVFPMMATGASVSEIRLN
ncbi:biosynthetic-type acetolactate synthase large subunit [Flavobacterium psychrophilum]|uniref:biosynthetic-type acetolactate synthase large subunit n=1 Tax=Flavobacterium psychrophilum TaxID=96345 RepID=UPI000B7C409B|nr:biosynthetic-type acetolactate synthase large subunit [Flavobacterium psychrophilum]MCB6088094.1 biosynthetic-type acetolactate synthase large subunit [Flavobacterium psychrophilum]MCB6230066.1 biosynthetic-type acetolactate synthase large subunit [Flavobacterium psychrophilum]QRE61040.1 biosynthetic-type acetolactate synthase large subunit [Flavobacterium psychrophilum]QRE63230.1 biosynthetic-type acetolactate synthase large subunit [Flavobacterium psychrophilum]SNA88067.1 acetolactate syn